MSIKSKAFLSSLSTWAVYKRLLQVVKPYRFILILGAISSFSASGVDALLAWMIKPLIDQGFIARNSTFTHAFPFLLIILFFFRGLTTFSSTYCIHSAGCNLVMDFRQQIFQHLLHTKAKDFDNTSSGKLLSVIIYNVDQISSAVTDALLVLLRQSSLVIGLIISMLIINWKLTLCFLLTAPFIAWVIRLTSLRIRRISRQIQDSLAEVSHLAEEAIEGYRVIRLFGKEHFEQKKFDQATQKNRQQQMKAVISSCLGSVIPQWLTILPIAAILYWVIHDANLISVGGFIALIVAMLRLLQPLQRLTRINAVIQKGLAGAQSVFALLDQPTEQDINIPHHTTQQDRIHGHLVLQNVHFSYDHSMLNKRPTLRDISLTIHPGSMVALVGRSGAGKSTLVSLLPRFYDILQGKIFLDHQPLDHYPLSFLRQQFSLVSQSVLLFNETIYYNIAYGQTKTIDPEAVITAAQQAHAWDFIQKLPQGLYTHIGENGVLLSGGERQRLAIARALLRNAPILILDEATASLDSKAEQHIQKAINQLIKNRTTLVIAHRLSTIQQADHIIVLDQGQIVEQGSHEQLLSQQGLYHELHTMQFYTPKTKL